MNRDRQPTRRDKRPGLFRRPAIAVTWLLLAAAAGCNWIGYGGHLLGGYPEEKKIKEKAQYVGLQDNTVAVLVAADEHTSFQYPSASQAVCRSICAKLKQDVAGIELTDPAQLVRFQRENPYWITELYGDLMTRLNVRRLVVVDLSTYTTHEPGNAHVWQGVIAGNVAVAEAEAQSPNNPVFTRPMKVTYPPGPVGLLDSDDATIQLGMLDLFSRDVSRLFHDHERVEK